MGNYLIKFIFKRFSVLTVPALALAVVLAGTAPAPAAPPGGKTEVVQDPDYVINPEDILEIHIWKNSDLSKTVTVRPDGKISLPLAGDIQAAGYTPNQLRDVILAKLKEYQQTAVVSVIVQEVNSYKIYIFGSVAKPGMYLSKSRMSILQAISLAGGFNQFASKNSIMLVRSRNGLSGKEERIRVRFDDLVNSDDKTDKNLMLRPGDTIFVP